MPRVTRAAMRSHVIEAAPSTPLKDRIPLSDITSIVQEELLSTHESDASRRVMKKTVVKAKKAKGTKRGHKKGITKTEVTSEVLDDENQSEMSSAVDEACGELLKESTGDSNVPPPHDLNPDIPSSPAVQALQRLLSSNAVQSLTASSVNELPLNTAPSPVRKTTQKPSVPEMESPHSTLAINTRDDEPEANGVLPESAIETDSSNLPAVQQSVEMKDDSFVEQIKMRTPLKPRMRIEDSVEAIDALEDAIEKVGEALPNIRDGPESPIKDPRSNKTPGKKSMAKAKPTPKVAPSMTTRSASNARSSAAKMSPSKRAARGIRPVPTSNVKTTAKPRVSSITKPPFIPIKSSKPPTRSTFTLPGDAIAQKLKAQREERSKREEDDASKKKEFKARPGPAKTTRAAPVVRTTATSRARLSMAQGESIEPSLKRKSSGLLDKITGRPSTSALNKRISTLSLANGSTKRPSTLVPSKPSPSLSPHLAASTIRKPSTAASSSTLDSTAIATAKPTPKSKGKEVFNRGKVEAEEMERMKREKEEAAKKARKEASERGRQASREWAEKMKMRGKEKVKGGKGEEVAV